MAEFLMTSDVATPKSWQIKAGTTQDVRKAVFYLDEIKWLTSDFSPT
jgi:hypothetical protein